MRGEYFLGGKKNDKRGKRKEKKIEEREI